MAQNDPISKFYELIIPSGAYSPISATGGGRRRRKHTRKLRNKRHKKTNKSRTRRHY